MQDTFILGKSEKHVHLILLDQGICQEHAVSHTRATLQEASYSKYVINRSRSELVGDAQKLSVAVTSQGTDYLSNITLHCKYQLACKYCNRESANLISMLQAKIRLVLNISHHIRSCPRRKYSSSMSDPSNETLRNHSSPEPSFLESNDPHCGFIQPAGSFVSQILLCFRLQR